MYSRSAEFLRRSDSYQFTNALVDSAPVNHQLIAAAEVIAMAVAGKVPAFGDIGKATKGECDCSVTAAAQAGQQCSADRLDHTCGCTKPMEGSCRCCRPQLL